MKALNLAGAMVVALTLSTTMALAQTGPHVGDGKNSVTPPYPYNSGGAAAKVGDGTNSLNPYTGQAPYSYNVGSGASGANARKAYVGGRTQSLAPPPGWAKAESSDK